MGERMEWVSLSKIDGSVTPTTTTAAGGALRSRNLLDHVKDLAVRSARANDGNDARYGLVFAGGDQAQELFEKGMVVVPFAVQGLDGPCVV